MVDSFDKRGKKRYLESEGYRCHYDRDGNLVAVKGYESRHYDKDGGYYLSSGPSGVYVDKFGNT